MKKTETTLDAPKTLADIKKTLVNESVRIPRSGPGGIKNRVRVICLAKTRSRIVKTLRAAGFDVWPRINATSIEIIL